MLSEKEFIDAELKAGICYTNPLYRALAQRAYDQVKDLKFNTVIDYGCGTGTFAQVLLDNGCNVFAQDISKVHRDYLKKTFPDLKVIAKPVKSDLMYFIEVAEHMEDMEIVRAIDKIDPEFILFSSTSEKTDNDEPWGHINIKEEKDWIEFWSGLGYKLKTKVEYPTLWSMILERV